MFDESKADFTNGVYREELIVGKVSHSAYIRVNEEGTEAAAASGINS
jgi:serpin B